MEIEGQRQIAAREIRTRVDELLRWRMIFSILWLTGFGSTVAMISGFEARRLILDSGGELRGMERVRSCLILGILGLLIWVPLVVIGIANNL